MLVLFAVLGPVHPRTVKLFLPSFLSQRHSREKRYQALSNFSILIAMESWAGPGNETIINTEWPCSGAKLFSVLSCPSMETDSYSIPLVSA